MTAAEENTRTLAPGRLDELVQGALAGLYGDDPAMLEVSVGFVTTQGSRHAGRSCGYRNQTISLRVGAAVGSCAVEPGQLASNDPIDDLVGTPVAGLLRHPVGAIRVAALDAYLMHASPHPHAGGVAGRPAWLPGGTSLAKSLARAGVVVDLLPIVPGQRVLVLGVVNSLLARLRELGIAYIPCDRAGGCTEWGEPVIADGMAHIGRCDAVLATGMTLGNGTFDSLLPAAVSAGVPLVMFAQSGSAVLPWFLGSGVHAVSAEPFPFFNLDGSPSTLFQYRFGGTAR